MGQHVIFNTHWHRTLSCIPHPHPNIIQHLTVFNYLWKAKQSNIWLWNYGLWLMGGIWLENIRAVRETRKKKNPTICQWQWYHLHIALKTTRFYKITWSLFQIGEDFTKNVFISLHCVPHHLHKQSVQHIGLRSTLGKC